MGDDTPIPDTVIWQSGDAFISVTPANSICISVGGLSFVLPADVWHQLGKGYFGMTKDEQKRVRLKEG